MPPGVRRDELLTDHRRGGAGELSERGRAAPLYRRGRPTAQHRRDGGWPVVAPMPAWVAGAGAWGTRQTTALPVAYRPGRHGQPTTPMREGIPPAAPAVRAPRTGGAVPGPG